MRMYWSKIRHNRSQLLPRTPPSGFHHLPDHTRWGDEGILAEQHDIGLSGR